MIGTRDTSRLWVVLIMFLGYGAVQIRLRQTFHHVQTLGISAILRAVYLHLHLDLLHLRKAFDVSRPLYWTLNRALSTALP
jgi:hypothetical protein